VNNHRAQDRSTPPANRVRVSRTAEPAVLARTGFFVLYSVFKEHHGREWCVQRDQGSAHSSVCGHAPATRKRYLCPATAATGGSVSGLLAWGEGSSERSANLPAGLNPVKPDFWLGPVGGGL
jgi:hypothetical protein